MCYVYFQLKIQMSCNHSLWLHDIFYNQTSGIFHVKNSLADFFGGHTSNAVNIYEQSVGGTPNRSAKSSFNNLSYNRINVSWNSLDLVSFLGVFILQWILLNKISLNIINFHLSIFIFLHVNVEAFIIDLCFNCLLSKSNLFIFETSAFTKLELSWKT